jgi:serpin B
LNRIFLAFLISALGIYSGEARAMDSSEPVAALVQGNGAFALDLYGRISQGEGNRFISPFSVSSALAMTYAGAQGETAVQIAKTLHFLLPPAQLHPAFHRLIAELHSRNTPQSGQQPSADVELFTASALWSQSGERMLPDFQKRVEIEYQGGLYPVDFRKDPEGARRTINAWAEEKTRGKIQDLLEPRHIEPRTVLILTNAIYFKALWARPFSKDRTAREDFQASATDRVPVDMMKLNDRFRFSDEGTFQALELPYRGDALAMVILLPKSKDGLSQLESSLTFPRLESALKKLSSHRVDLSLPRFKMTVGSELKDPLSALGMPLAFDRAAADFSGITGTRDFVISAVVHKAFVEVDEKGTEAAAATAVAMPRLAKVASPAVIFRADHPFFFMIRDTRTGSILFLGRLVRP